MTAPNVQLGPKEDRFSGWSRDVTLDGKRFRVGVNRGKMVRIPYKPRGQNTGFRWNGWVMDETARPLWNGEVGKSTGARGLLREAGLIDRCDKCRKWLKDPCEPVVKWAGSSIKDWLCPECKEAKT